MTSLIPRYYDVTACTGRGILSCWPKIICVYFWSTWLRNMKKVGFWWQSFVVNVVPYSRTLHRSFLYMPVLLQGINTFNIYPRLYSITSYPNTIIPSYPRTLIPSHPHTLIPSYLHTLVPSYPRTLIHSYPHTLIPSDPHTLVRTIITS